MQIKISTLDKIAIMLFFMLLSMAIIGFSKNYGISNSGMDKTNIDDNQVNTNNYSLKIKEATF